MRIVRFFLVLAICGCVEPASIAPVDKQPPAKVRLNGHLQKGPFLLGSDVEASPLDASGNPTGQVFSVQTDNHRGEFSLEVTPGMTMIKCNGFYYNEVTGDRSVAPITLYALYDVQEPGPQAATVNLLSHLVYHRAKKLVADGETFADAIEQAEGELRDELPLDTRAFDVAFRATSMTILGGDTDRNAYLLAASAMLVQVGSNLAGGETTIDAAFSEFMNQLSLDLKDDGTISVANKALLNAAKASLDGYAVMNHLAARMEEIGVDEEVPNIFRALNNNVGGVGDIACPGGPNDCPSGLGCAVDVCDSCANTAQCQTSQWCNATGACQPCGQADDLHCGASCAVCGSLYCAEGVCRCDADEQCSGDEVCREHACVCDPETDQAFCARQSSACGPVTANDNCGEVRTLNCGDCSEMQGQYGCGTGSFCSNPDLHFFGECANNACVCYISIANTCGVFCGTGVDLYCGETVNYDQLCGGTSCREGKNCVSVGTYSKCISE